MRYTHLQVRSGYSLMKSSITIEKLVYQAKKLGFTSLALTDEQVMHGAISFYQLCKQVGIKPIIGMVVEVESDNLVLLAKNNQGYTNLLKLSSYLQLNKNSIRDIQDVAEYLADLIVILPLSTSYLNSMIHKDQYSQLISDINNWKTIIRNGEFFLGIQHEGMLEQNQLGLIKKICEKYHIAATAISDVRYLNKEDKYAYSCLQAMRTGDKWTLKQSENIADVSYLKSNEESLSQYKNVWPELITETERIADKCNVVIDFNKRMIPSYPVPKGYSASNYLKQICMERLSSKYELANQTVRDRLDYELNVIESMEFSDYFLIVWDFIAYARQEGILVGPGRGSAAGSLVAYLLDITKVDPIKYNLLFERFLNPERVSMPDIDIDFSDQRRDEVIQYVREKYGAEHVAQIITFGTFATRSLVRELIKTMNIDQQDASFILREMATHNAQTVAESVKASTALIDYVRQSKDLQLLFKVAAKLEGLPRHISTHAAGVVISKDPLVEHVPLIMSNETHLTQYAMTELESVGLLKMDFLGLRNLTLMERIIASIKRQFHTEIKIADIPLDDSQTFSLLQKGKTNGVFQLESQGMQQVLTSLKPSHFEDVVAVNALYRPGPMEFIQTYIKRKHNEEPVSYPHDSLQPILKKTYGVLVYQEQIMQIANKMANFSLGQADILRRAVSKKQKDVLESQKQQFIQGCIDNGYGREVAEEIYNWIVKFSNYGFNRSHAVAYSMISYQLAYLKTHFPAHFLAEVLSSYIGQNDKARVYFRELREFAIDLLPPSINYSFGKYTVENDKVRIGLMAIKGVGHQAIREIIRTRKDGAFKHIYDFCLRISLKTVNRQVIESLILAGAFDETHPNRASLLATLDQAIEQGELFKEFEDQPSLFHNDVELDVTYTDKEPFSQMKQLSFEKELIGEYISSHPLLYHRNLLRANGYISLGDLKKHLGKSNIKSSAVIQEVRTIRTKRGDSMAFVKLSDEDSEIDAVIFPDLYRDVSRKISNEMIVFVKGKVDQRNGRTQLILADISPFSKEALNTVSSKRLFVKVTDDNQQQVLNQIKEIADRNPGNTAVLIYQPYTKRTYKLASDYYVQLNQTCLKQFYQAFGKEKVAIK